MEEEQNTLTLPGIKTKGSSVPIPVYFVSRSPSGLIDRELLRGNFRGVKMNRGGPDISHVMYADDIMLFSKANVREVEVLNGCLEKYCY